MFISLYIFAIALANILAVVVDTSARSTGLVRLTEHRDAFGGPVYSWMISQDEQERLSVLLKADFYDTGIEGTYVTAPPQVCPHCGKKTEFIDWVYTALERGVHSPEFIFESLQAGRTPEGVHHDVYCSGCGHLTHVRDSSGNEGGALHISHATPYDRSTRKFGKREAEPTAASDEESERLEPAGWPAGPFRWVLKREDNSEVDTEASTKKLETLKPAGWPPGPFRWVLKREDTPEVNAEASDEATHGSPETAGAFWAVGPKIFDWPLRRATHDVQLASVESGSEVDATV